MGLAKGQARRIWVDGRSFRWTISRARQASAGEVDVVIELAERPKQRVVASVPCRDFWLDFPDIVESRKPADMRECDRLAGLDAYRPVTPRVVEQLIREATANGWRPDVAGKPLRFDGKQAAAAALLRRNVGEAAGPAAEGVRRRPEDREAMTGGLRPGRTGTPRRRDAEATEKILPSERRGR